MMEERRPIPYADSAQIAAALMDHLEKLDALKGGIRLNDPDKGPCVALQMLPGSGKTAEYMDGSYEARYDFAVLLRIDGRDSAQRLAAAGLLDTISRYLQTSFPDIGESRSVSGLEASSAPCTAAVYEDQTEDWQTTFTMQYMQEG